MLFAMPPSAIFGQHLNEDSAVMHGYAILMRMEHSELNYNHDERARALFGSEKRDTSVNMLQGNTFQLT